MLKRNNMKVAVIQHPPKYLNLTKSMDLAVELIQTAAKKGSKLIVFPEAWFPGYPEYVWRLKPGAEMSLTDDLFKISQANSIDLSKDQMKPIQDAAKKNKVVIVAGYQEIDGEVSGSTLFCSIIIINNDGSILNNHRKLMPTNPERMVWGPGDGSGLNVVETPVGRIGTLACWENYMPLARYSLYSQNIDIYIAPTWDEGEPWLSSMNHISREGGCWVISCSTAIQASDLPDDMPHKDHLYPDKNEWINCGDAVIYKPFGGVHAGPLHKEKGILYSDIDISLSKASRRRFDATGHYSRPDVFNLTVDKSKKKPVR